MAYPFDGATVPVVCFLAKRILEPLLKAAQQHMHALPGRLGLRVVSALMRRPPFAARIKIRMRIVFAIEHGHDVLGQINAKPPVLRVAPIDRTTWV